MSRPPCILCGRPSMEDHHVVGARVDGELTAPHCHDHHELVHDDWWTLVHDDWWTLGVGAKRPRGSSVDADEPPTVLHRLCLALRRAAAWLGRLAARGRFQPLTGWLAAALARWALALQLASPGWTPPCPSGEPLPGWR